MKLNLTLKPGTTKKVAKKAVKIARDAGATKVAPLYDKPPLPELDRFYSIDTGAADGKRIVEALKNAEGVEAVEAGIKRKLIKGAK